MRVGTVEIVAHSEKIRSHSLKDFAFSQAEDLKFISEGKRRVKVIMELDFSKVCLLIYFFLWKVIIFNKDY